MCRQSNNCQKPEHHEGQPADCSPEQVRECHGDVPNHPCEDTDACEHPEKLGSRPADCSPEQVRECHGDNGHPCEKQ